MPTLQENVPDARRPVVAVAGAAGFVGRTLRAALARETRVICLTRRPVATEEPDADGVKWRRADLFSLLQLEQGLAGADVAIYLVHSMLPHARLTQGRFEDIDFLLADNFARAARRMGVKRILYLGGIDPEAGPHALSPHLTSRHEVERVLASHDVPVVSVRAGLIVGKDGSSFRILERLVLRLPVMLCPSWTKTRGQPVHLDDVVQVLVHAAFDDGLPAGAYDVASPERVTYREMLERTAAATAKRRFFVNVPFFTPGLSRLWVSLVTGSPRELVYPLVESLQHDMSTTDDRLFRRYDIHPRRFDEALADALKALPDQASAPKSAHGDRPTHDAEDAVACSIQRLPLPPGASVGWIVRQYVAWLPRAVAPLLHVRVQPRGHLTFELRPLLGAPLLPLRALELHFSEERSTPTRQMFYVAGGRLLDRDACPDRARGRFEFRAVPGRDEVVAALFDFRPSLPWWLYNLTQARVHLWIMRAFGRHLRRIARSGAVPALPTRGSRFTVRP